MEIIGKVLGINTSDGLFNILVEDSAKKQYNIKWEKEPSLEIGCVYCFEVVVFSKERLSYRLIDIKEISCFDMEKEDAVLRTFLNAAPLSLQELKNELYCRINAIQSPVIAAITKGLITRYEKAFLLYPAASRMHHSYVGGLAYHCIGMLKLADAFIANYDYLNKDYLYAGILLHDIGKVVELSGPQNTKYTLEGQLLGHLVIGAMAIQEEAIKLGLADHKEVLMLKHLLISHHGQPQYGAAKKPATPEALALWYMDTLDSKFRVLGEELEKTEAGTYTDTIGVLDKMKIYKEK